MLVIDLSNEIRKGYAIKQIQNLPCDNTMEIEIRKRKKQRSLNQNAAMWGVRLKEISEGVFVNGEQFCADAWHELLKQRYLPEIGEPEFERMVTRPDTYKKWEWLPDGTRRCVGSTTGLTTYGWQVYWTQIESYFAQEHGLQFQEFVRSS